MRHRLFGALMMTVPMTVSQAAVEINGITDELLANVQAHLTLDDLDCDADPQLVRREYDALDREVRDALRALGHYRATIAAELDLDADCWEAVVEIDAGRQTTIRGFVLDIVGGDDDVAFSRIAANPGLATGNGLHHGRYEALKRRLRDVARDRGYPEAELTTARIDVYPDAAAADIAIRFETGPRYSVGPVTIEQDALAEDFVSNYITVETGQPFNNNDLSATHIALANSGYFDTISVRALAPDAETKTIPVSVTVAGAPRLRINYGVGFSTDTGPRVRIGRDIRRFNDRGHQLTVDSQLSPVVSEVSANYRLPYGDPRFEWASFDGGIKREDTETAESKSLEFGARRVLERAGGWSRTQFLDLLVEDFDVAEQTGRSRLLMPGINWTRLRADNALRPERGERLNIEVRGAGDAIGSDTSFVQTTVDYKLIRSFGSGARILARATAGATADDRFEDLPPSVRYFAGGDTSIRGYDFESLGPLDETGNVIGGEHLFVASIEYEHPVRDRWSVAVFADSGNAFAGSDFDAKTGVGIGARWRSPLGPVRLDIGFPVNDPTANPRIHISLGPDL